ncbi:MAG: type II toxin-antitoxin system PemK/MazF family toxin [Acidobacteriota bacterium]|nr:type II toxin-antitoxin system PemK/MazF family toxin [Acidobacteriota bacterium]
MKIRELKVTRIGNSRGVRLPASSLKRYDVGSSVIMEERTEGILLRPVGDATVKLGWEDTAREMAGSGEDWSEWDTTVGDGLDLLPWDPSKKPRVEEHKSRYKTKPQPSPQAFWRYEIRWAALDPSRDSEMAKTLPVVIMSLNEMNARLGTVTVCPLTSRLHPAWRCRLSVSCMEQPAEIAVDQFRTVSKARLGSKIGMLSDDEAARLRRLITEMYGE